MLNRGNFDKEQTLQHFSHIQSKMSYISARLIDDIDMKTKLNPH